MDAKNLTQWYLDQTDPQETMIRLITQRCPLLPIIATGRVAEGSDPITFHEASRTVPLPKDTSGEAMGLFKAQFDRALGSLGVEIGMGVVGDITKNLTGTSPGYGFRVASVSETPGEAITRLSTHGFATYSSEASLAVVHPLGWESLVRLLSAHKVEPERVAIEDLPEYSSIKLLCQGAKVEVIHDLFVPVGAVYLLDVDTCAVGHPGEKLLNVTVTDTEVDISAKYAFVTEAPWLSGSASYETQAVEAA